MKHTGPNLAEAMRAEWCRRLAERRVREGLRRLRAVAPTPSILSEVTRPEPPEAA